MTGIEFIAAFITTGTLHGVGIGSTLAEVEQAIPADFIEERDEGNLSIRRDYGPIEIYFSNRSGWKTTGATLEQHRLAANPELPVGWSREMEVLFPQYVTWTELREHLSRIPGHPNVEQIDQGGFLEFRAAETRVSVLVVDSREERDDWPGQGDVWSVSLG